MAIFGAPVAHEDDPERAVRAALAARDAVQELNEANPSLDLHVRIAVNTGEAVVAIDANPSGGEGMVAGDVVNTASRLQTAAPVDGILVGETTYRATERVVEYRECEPVQAKGKADPLPVWEALGARARYGVDVFHRGGAELVGRGEELDWLTDGLARTLRERRTQLVTLVGVPGIGKSRLVWELAQAVDADPDLIVYWRQGRSLPYGEGVAFWAVGEMVKAQAGILETDSAEAAETKLHEMVADLIPDAESAAWIEGHLRPLVGITGEVDPGGDRRDEAFGDARMESRRAEVGVGRRGRRGTVRGGEPARERVDLRRLQAAGSDALAPERAIGEPAHPHGDIDHLAIAVEAGSVRPSAHLDHVEIQVRCEAAVEAQLLVAAATPFGQAREVEEVETDGLLELVGQLSCQQHPRHVRLDHAHRRALARLELLAQRRDAHARLCDMRIVGHAVHVPRMPMRRD